MVLAPQPSLRSHTVVLKDAFHWSKHWHAALAVPLMLALFFAALTLAASPGAHASSGTWQGFTYSGPAGSRPYFVYTPAGYQTGAVVPLFVMLHGCLQTPSDFAAGTQMDALADAHQFIVVYPQQTSKYNSSECWNWFLSADQSRGSGEPAIIAGIVQTVEQTTSRWSIDTHRVYVAGISAGAAMTVILGATYPDIFAAIGVHSGLEYKAATSAGGALVAQMNGGPSPTQQGQAAYNAMGSRAREVPTIVFHGSADTVVYPINGNQVVQQWMETDYLASNGVYNPAFCCPNTTIDGAVIGGHTFNEFIWNDANGHEVQEYWFVYGMGHAWSGGSTAGSFTDPFGPSASQAMYTFFINHPK
ncbi:MAG TPA: PHB depolymerase family esterase [Ktedonobacterales bacterium]|nr:PHB depolymerase family esterase [Ktedonobacterales bacterium]